MNSSGISPKNPPSGGGSCQKSPLNNTFKPPNGRCIPRAFFLKGHEARATARNLQSMSASKRALTILISSMISQRHCKSCLATSSCFRKFADVVVACFFLRILASSSHDELYPLLRDLPSQLAKRLRGSVLRFIF